MEKNVDIQLQMLLLTMSKKFLPKIILVEPQIGENIGSSARAMLNFGLNELNLVKPRDGWPNRKASATSAGALEDLNFKVEVFNNLEESIKDTSFIIATTARKRDINKPVLDASEAIKNIYKFYEKGLKTAIIFGGEKSGLNNSDLVKTDVIVNIDTNSEFSSINLSMSVFAMCYQWNIEKNILITDGFNNLKKENNANKEELKFFIDRLVNVLDSNNFFYPDSKRKSMLHNIEAIFTRNNLTSQELRILHGIISNLINAELKDRS